MQKIRGTALYVIVLFILTIFVYCRVLFAIFAEPGSSSLSSKGGAVQHRETKHLPTRQYYANNTTDSQPSLTLNETIDNNNPISLFKDRGKATAKILSRTNQLTKLLKHLDASDVIECYVVNRMAPLANVGSSFGITAGGGDSSIININNKASPGEDNVGNNSTSNNFPTGPIHIRKSALAFRYRSRVALASHGHHFSAEEYFDNLSPGDQLEQQKYFELTLEYGPQRTGVTKVAESMPMVHIEEDGKFVNWHNEGSIYYTTLISKHWTDAYYMSSVTGFVLEKIIQRAVEYTYKKPRYQPFEVISLPSQKRILKSSTSDDFVYNMFNFMAQLYVDIDPLVLPPWSRVQLYVADPDVEEQVVNEDRVSEDDDNGEEIIMKKSKKRLLNPNVKKVQGTDEVTNAALFYDKFFKCANAIRTGDYSMFISDTTKTTVRGNDNVTSDRGDTGGVVSNIRRLLVEKASFGSFFDHYSNATDEEVLFDTIKSNSTSVITEVVGDNNPTHNITRIYNDTLFNITEKPDDDLAEIAEKASIEAAEAAENVAAVVANSSSTADFAAATEEASKAAQKAKDAAVAARSKASIEALLSGDGEQVTSVLSNCFTDPKYGIQKEEPDVVVDEEVRIKEDSSTTIVAYIYIDGHTFFRLNLEAPYWGVMTSSISVPPPLMPKRGSTDVIDWAIIIFFISFALVGILVMLHQLEIYVIDKRLQLRRIFHPTKSESDFMTWKDQGIT